MNVQTIYLAAAIDLAKQSDASLKAAVRIALDKSDVCIYDPKNAFSVAPKHFVNHPDPEAEHVGEYVAEVNRIALYKADLRVFIVTESASWGLPTELMLVIGKRLPFLLINRTQAILPLYLRNLLSMAQAKIAGIDRPFVLDIYKEISVGQEDYSKYIIWESRGGEPS